MTKNYLPRSVIALVGAGLLWSITESKWFYSMTKTNYFDRKQKIEQQENLEDYLPVIETLCPEHLDRNYIPASKNSTNYFPIKSSTNRIERIHLARNKIGNLV